MLQAVIFGTMYSLYTNMQDIYGNPPYSFSTSQVGLLYLGPGLGFLTAVWFLVPRIDTVFNKMTKENGGESKPEFRLPLANIGAVLLPVTLFIIAWTIEYRDRVHWSVSIIAAYFLGLGQVMIFSNRFRDIAYELQLTQSQIRFRTTTSTLSPSTQPVPLLPGLLSGQ